MKNVRQFSPNYLMDNRLTILNDYKNSLSLYNSLCEKNKELGNEIDYMYKQRLIAVYGLKEDDDLSNYKLSEKQYLLFYNKYKCTLDSFKNEIIENRKLKKGLLELIKTNKKYIKLSNDYNSLRNNSSHLC